eukprot:3317383-Amphidinium_carterae.1
MQHAQKKRDEARSQTIARILTQKPTPTGVYDAKANRGKRRSGLVISSFGSPNCYNARLSETTRKD